MAIVVIHSFLSSPSPSPPPQYHILPSAPMSAFNPDTDAVIIREHFYYDTKVDSLVLTDSTNGEFLPVEARGLGLFNYQFSDNERVPNQELRDQNGQPAPASAALLLQEHSVQVAVVVGLVLFGLLVWKYHRILHLVQRALGVDNKQDTKDDEKYLPVATTPGYYRKIRQPVSRKRRNSLRKSLSAPFVNHFSNNHNSTDYSLLVSQQQQPILYDYDYGDLSEASKARKVFFASSSNLANSHHRFNNNNSPEDPPIAFAPPQQQQQQKHASENPFAYNTPQITNLVCEAAVIRPSVTTTSTTTPSYNTKSSYAVATPASSISSADSVFSPDRTGRGRFSPYRHGHDHDDALEHSPIMGEYAPYNKEHIHYLG